MLRQVHVTVRGGVGYCAGQAYRRSIQNLSLVVDRPARAKGLEGSYPESGGRRKGSTFCAATFIAPPEELKDGYFERPTPLLLVAGEAQPPAWWSRTASFFAARGCTVGTMALSGRGSSFEDVLTLKALQAGVAMAVANSGLTPPVLVAYSIAGFVCQQYLQSYPAAGLVLLDSFPPKPSRLAKEHLALIRSREKNEFACLDPVVNSLGIEELASLVKDTPSQWENCFRRYFDALHENAPWQGPTPQDENTGSEASTKGFPQNSLNLGAIRPRFPAKAFAEMCLEQPSSTLRLERHAVDTLVLGSRGYPVDTTRSLDFGALEAARREGLDETCEFHGTDGWRSIDEHGRVEGLDSSGSGSNDSNAWREVVWEWYNARF